MKTHSHLLLVALAGLCLAGCRSGVQSATAGARDPPAGRPDLRAGRRARRLRIAAGKHAVRKRVAQEAARHGRSRRARFARRSDARNARRALGHAAPARSSSGQGRAAGRAGSGNRSGRGIRSLRLRPLAHPAPTDADQNVQRIVLNKQLTGGISHTGRGGDRVFWSSSSRATKPGRWWTCPAMSRSPCSIRRRRVRRRALRGGTSRPRKPRASFGKTALGRGYQFELPWPSQPPHQSRNCNCSCVTSRPTAASCWPTCTIDIAPPTDREAKRWRWRAHRLAPSADRLARLAPPLQLASVPANAMLRRQTQAPTAKFLDPPQIVPEDDPTSRSRFLRRSARRFARTTARDGFFARGSRSGPEERQPAKSARPVWSPYR